MEASSGNPSEGGFRALAAILKEDWHYNATMLERVVVLTYRFRNWGTTRRPRFLWRIVSFGIRPLELCLRAVYSGQVSARATIGRRLRLAHAWGVGIGPSVVIGDDCQIFHQVVLGVNEPRNLWLGPRLESGVYVGVGAKVLGPLVIGQNAIVAANSLVLHNVPPNHLAIGVPATNRPIRRSRRSEDPVPSSIED